MRSGTSLENARASIQPIPDHFVAFCRKHKLTFTRSRPYKKNDNAHIEQKNWTHVRKLFGYQRLYEERIADLMNSLYRDELPLWMNLFHPNVKLIAKKRVGSRIHRIYDRAQTPLERPIALDALTSDQRVELEGLRDRTDPFVLAERIEGKLAEIRALTLHQSPQGKRRQPGPPISRPPAGQRAILSKRAAVAPAREHFTWRDDQGFGNIFGCLDTYP